MSELLATTPERKLWFGGPNYTADAVVIDPDTARILLIQRRDTGDWALPGGFIDAADTSPLSAAIREAHEEAGLALNNDGSLIFRGIVDDPRNDETAWIETSAYLFAAPSSIEPHAHDDAQAAAWHDLAELPPLYASHHSIIGRALDYLEGAQLLDVIDSPDTRMPVDGGHMEYDKHIATKNDQPVFAKQHNPKRYHDPEKAERSLTYLEKEASTMAHLREHHFSAIPERSLLHRNTLAMDAFRPEDGWKWRADTTSIDQYINDSLEAFLHLETMPIPADSFAIDPSYESFALEGWRSFDDSFYQKLRQRRDDFAPRLTPDVQAIADELLATLPTLHRAALQPHQPDQLVFCHHDVRQSNIAWHPDHGTKLVDWSWAGIGEAGSDRTSLLIDLHKSGHDISGYLEQVNARHCLALIGFWLGHSTWPHRGDDTVRSGQFTSAVSAYDLLRQL